jgi:hypothetical protein
MLDQNLVDTIKNKKWLFVSFAPGANGYLLGKWLINNKICGIPFNNNDNFTLNQTESNNHDYVGYLYDIFTGPTWSDRLELELSKNQFDQETIFTILSTTHTNVFSDQPYNLVLLHYSSYNVLRNLQKMFNNAKIIRIMFESEEQANDALKRKLQVDNLVDDKHYQIGILVQDYYPYLFNFDFTIDILWQKVKALDLDFLKELL